MAQTYRSRPVEVEAPPEKVFGFLSDFRHFEELLPEGEVEGWQADERSCSFVYGGVGRVTLAVEEAEPDRYLRIRGDSGMKIPFSLEVLLAPAGQGTRVELVLEASLNVFVRALAERPLKEFLETLAAHLERFDFRAGRPRP